MRGSTQTGVPDTYAIAQAAPCSGFSHLLPISAILTKIADVKMKRHPLVQQLTSSEGLRKLQDSFEPHLKALGELLRAMRAAQEAVYEAKIGAHGLKKAASDAQKNAAKKRERLIQAADNAANKRIKAEPTLDLHEQARETFKMEVPPEFRIQRATIELLEAKKISLNQPWVMVGEQAKHLQTLANDEGFKKEVADAVRMFKHSSERTNPTKGKAKILFADKSIRDTVAKAMVDSLPGVRCVDELPFEEGRAPSRESSVGGPDLLALVGQKMQVSFEGSCLPALKWTVSGSKTVMVWSFSEIGHFVRKQLGGRALKQPISSHAVNQFLLTLNPEKHKTMQEEMMNTMHVATLGPGDLLFLPAGCIKAELPAHDDLLSVRMSILPDYDDRDKISAIHNLSVCQAELVASGRRNAILDAVLQLLEKKEPELPARLSTEVRVIDCGDTFFSRKHQASCTAKEHSKPHFESFDFSATQSKSRTRDNFVLV